MTASTVAPGHQHRRVECARCGAVLLACQCAPGQETVASCNLCLRLTDQQAAYAKERRTRA